MGQYKAIVTTTWKFESEDEEAALAYAKSQIESILNTNPHGDDFDGFSVQVDLAKMKDRKRLIHLGSFELDEVMPYITEFESKKDYTVGNKTYTVKMNSDRYHVFKANNKCVSCGLAGTKMILDMNVGDQTPHFNMYGEEHGRLVLMTKDHILAKSKGGSEELSNFQNCCSICNNLKGAYDLTHEQIRELRKISNNEDKVPRKELRTIINNKRDEMAQAKG